jgi:Rps23 Pro-64 3,4-dihydroxylase Tpa1-like proline 4-hydroxylase
MYFGTNNALGRIFRCWILWRNVDSNSFAMNKTILQQLEAMRSSVVKLRDNQLELKCTQRNDVCDVFDNLNDAIDVAISDIKQRLERKKRAEEIKRGEKGDAKYRKIPSHFLNGEKLDKDRTEL